MSGIGNISLDSNIGFNLVQLSVGGELNLNLGESLLSGASIETGFALGTSLAEGYAARTGLLNPLSNIPLLRTTTNTQSDRDFDGFYVGADGNTYSPTTPLNEIPAVQPSDGRTPNETLIYVNGVNTTKDGQYGSLQAIADQTGAQVIGIHNSTEGSFVDVIQSIGDKLDIGTNPAVDTLADTVYNEISAGRTVHLMAHSQGALITSRALQDVKNRLMLEDGMSRREAESLLSNVKVETFGGAAGSYPNGPQYVHYVNRRDPIAALFGLGPFSNPFVHSGRGAVVHRFSEGDNAHGFEATYLPRRVPFEQARANNFDR